MQKLIQIVTKSVLEIIESGGPEAKELALRMADAALDFFEEKAAATGNTIDDHLLAMVRVKLRVPEFMVERATEGGE